MAILPSFDTLLKAILLPAAIALAIYLSAVYIIYPLYAHRQRYSQYLPVSLDTEDSTSFVGQTRNGIHRAFEPIRNTSLVARAAVLFAQISAPFMLLRNKRRRVVSFDSYFGDEELDDGVASGGFGDAVVGRRDADVRDQGSERRLSRELEAGFRDDSDSEEEGHRVTRVR